MGVVAGWVLALPVPFLIIYAPAWWWIDLANVLLGANQALAWSMTVIMKIDLVGPKRRGLALGLNEFAGYFAVGVTSWLTGYLAAQYGLRPQPFYLGIGIAVVGLVIAILFVRETHGFARLEAARVGVASGPAPSFRRIFYVTSVANVSLFAACQAGLVNNLNDGMSWDSIHCSSPHTGSTWPASASSRRSIPACGASCRSEPDSCPIASGGSR